jgi:protein-tyrosine phosphatase
MPGMLRSRHDRLNNGRRDTGRLRSFHSLVIKNKMIKVLMVCLGNICRSPLAEGILRKKLEERDMTNVIVDSAGTSSYHTGECPDQRSIRNARSHGVDISGLKARQFTVDDFDEFDYIYVMDTSNYGNVMMLARNEKDKKKVRFLLDIISPGSNMSVPDPYFGGEQGFENVYVMVDKACQLIADMLKERHPHEVR